MDVCRGGLNMMAWCCTKLGEVARCEDAAWRLHRLCGYLKYL